MNPVFVSSEGRVLDLEKPKAAKVVEPPIEESFDQMAFRSAEQQSTKKR